MPQSFRDHQPIILDTFNGLWDRGDRDTTPLDHFQDCDNIKFVGSNVTTRDGIDISQTVKLPLRNVLRIYDYPTATGNTLIALVQDTVQVANFVSGVPTPIDIQSEDSDIMEELLMGTVSRQLQAWDPDYTDDTDDVFFSNQGNLTLTQFYITQGYTVLWAPDLTMNSYDYVEEEPFIIPSVTTVQGPRVSAFIGQIFHVVDAQNVYGPLLQIIGMTDFAFVPFAGRGYISPVSSGTRPGLGGDYNVETGVNGEFLYVYMGDGTACRKAAGAGMSGSMTIANGAVGHTDAGLHIFGFVSQTRSGYNSPPSILTQFTTSPLNAVSFGNIPTSGDPNVVKRLLVATKVLSSFNGDLSGYQFFFVPNGVINNNTDTFLNNVSFYDADLLQDASALLDNYTSIPAGAALSIYHNRLCLAATYSDISLILVSQPGEPEAISQVDGLIVVPLDGNPITNMQEMRDLMYVTKRARTVSYTDNGDAPSSWPMILIDNALGAPIHGIATVLDTGTASVDYLIITTYQGVYLFNGRFVTPELSWKIENRWKSYSRSQYNKIQIVNAVSKKEFYIVLPDRTVLFANYTNGLDSKKIRWSTMSFAMGVNTVAIVNIDTIILGCNLLGVS